MSDIANGVSGAELIKKINGSLDKRLDADTQIVESDVIFQGEVQDGRGNHFYAYNDDYLIKILTSSINVASEGTKTISQSTQVFFDNNVTNRLSRNSTKKLCDAFELILNFNKPEKASITFPGESDRLRIYMRLSEPDVPPGNPASERGIYTVTYNIPDLKLYCDNILVQDLKDLRWVYSEDSGGYGYDDNEVLENTLSMTLKNYTDLSSKTFKLVGSAIEVTYTGDTGTTAFYLDLNRSYILDFGLDAYYLSRIIV